MSSRYFIGALVCFIFALVGIERTIYWCLFFLTFLIGFLIHFVLHQQQWSNSNPNYDQIQTSFIKAKLKTHINDFDFQTSTRSDPSLTVRESLTGIEDIDQSLYELIDLFVRDHIEIWYKTRISSDESFILDVKKGIYTAIRHLSERLRQIDWLDFCTGTMVDSFATHVRLYRKAEERMRLEQSTDIQSCFFDLEAEYERGICRDEVCLDKEKEREFLRDLVEVLIYILLPANEFRCLPVRVLLREVLVNLAFLPFIDMYSNADTINQLVIKMCQQIPLTIENFLSIVRTTDSKSELVALIDRLDVEIRRWSSKDTGGENDADIRATLNSYHYLKKLLNERVEAQNRLEPLIFDDVDIQAKPTYRDLSLNDILNNDNGLDYFLKFLQSVDAIPYGNFYINAEAFRCASIAAHQQINEITIEQQKKNFEILRAMANDLIKQYFLPTGSFHIPVEEHLIEKVLAQLQTDTFDETLLDELQGKIFEILSSEKYFGQFKSTPQYLRVLSEIDFTDSIHDNSDATSISSNNSNEIVNDVMDSASLQSSPSVSNVSGTTPSPSPLDHLENLENYIVTAEITDSGVCTMKGEKYAIYIISVVLKSLTGDQRREWVTYRRYSEFYDFHMALKKRCPHIRNLLHLPNKNFVNNTSQDVRLKRQKEFNDYLAALTAPRFLQNNPQLAELLMKFLRNQQWTHEQSEIARKVDTLVNPFKQASMGLVKGVSKIGGGLAMVSDAVIENTGRIFRSNTQTSDELHGNLPRDMPALALVAEAQAESSKNIPLRVLLVIMDEVFDLKQKNMWFRSRFVSILKRFLQTFMGASVNRRIVMFIQHWTSAKKIAKEINRFKETMWPNGILADKAPERDASIQYITQVLCKAKLLGIVSDELRHIIGSDTTRRGLLRLFALLQNENLNRRFVYVLLESLLVKLFRPNDLNLIFDQLYSQSSRVKEEFRRRIFDATPHHHQAHPGVILAQYHYGESSARPYYFNRLLVRTDDPMGFQRTNSQLTPPSASKSGRKTP